MIRLNRTSRFLVAGALGTALLTPPVAADGGTPVPCEQIPFAPSNPEFLGIVGNELMIAVAFEANLAYLAQMYRQAGVTHARVELNWEVIEWQPDSFDWGFTDLLVSTIANAGLRTLGAIHRTPGWASICPPEEYDYYYECIAANMDDYRDFVARAVQRYGPAGTGQIRDWEIRVENHPAGRPGYGLDDYLVELDAANDEIKALDSGARVWGPEVWFRGETQHDTQAMQWVTRAYNSGDVDVVAIHHFANTPQVANETTSSVCVLVDCESPTGTPVALTAMNVAGDPFTMTEAEQAENLDKMYRCVSAAGASHAMWFAGTQWHQQVPWIPCDTKRGVFRYTDLPTGISPACNVNMNNPNRLVPRLAYDALADLGEVIIGQLPPGQPYGLIGAPSNPCTPGAGSECSLDFYIFSTGVAEPYVQLRSEGQLVACGESNRAIRRLATVSAGTSRTFELYPVSGSCLNSPSGRRLATLTVVALPN